MKGQTNAIAKSSAGYERLIITVVGNQSEILAANVTVSYGDTVNEKACEGEALVFDVPQYNTYTVTFSDIEGYKTPESFTRIASSGNLYQFSANYYAEKVTVNVTSDNGESMDGKTVTIADKQYIVENGIVTALVPFESEYSISSEDVFGFATPDSKTVIANMTERNVSLVYRLNSLKITMSSNQAGETIDAKATVSYNGESVQVSSGEAIKIPSDTNVTITYPSVENYSTPSSETINTTYGLTEKNVIYSTEIVTVTVTTDDGESVEGQIVTINGKAHTLDSTGVATQKVAFGVSYTISLDEKTNYSTPSSISRTAQSVSYAVSMEYELAMETLTVNVSGIDSGFEITVQEIEKIDGYTVVEYIESNGSQYIDTGIVVNKSDNKTMFIDALFTNDAYGGCNGYMQFKSGIALNVRSEITVSYSSNIENIYVNGVLNSTDDWTNRYSESNVKLGLFRLGDPNNGWWSGGGSQTGRMYSCQIYDNGTLIRDYVPVKTDAGVYGLYDKVNNQFYGSASSTAFTGGSEAGDVIGTSTYLTSTFLIRENTNYMVYASNVSGYIVPESYGPYTAVAKNTRTVSMTYVYNPGTTSPSNGVYIKATNGYYYTANNWDGTYTADCVAVITNDCSFGIALTEASSEMAIYSSYSVPLENYMTAIEDESSAKADYNGATNTTNIMKLQSGTGYAAGWCNAYAFPSGKSGFLPSLGQMWAAYSNKSAVDTALTAAGGSALTSNYYWTSTFWGVFSSYRSCWVLGLSDGTVSFNFLNVNYRVRAFCSL